MACIAERILCWISSLGRGENQNIKKGDSKDLQADDVDLDARLTVERRCSSAKKRSS
jgi:hypothetical protein